jgi:O-antigen ligase
VLYALQALYTDDVTKAVEQVTFFYAPFALLYTLLRRVRFDRAVLLACLRVLVALLVVFVAVGFVEYARRHLLLNAPLSTALSNQQYFRVNSLFYDPNIYGRFLALVMIVLAAVMVWSARRDDALRCALLLALGWAGLVTSVSQSSIAALLAGLAVIGAVRFGMRRTGVIVVLGCVAVAGVAAFAGGAFHLDLGNGASANNSLNGRYSLVRGGLSMFGDRPLAGFGSGSFSRQFKAHGYATAATATTESHTTPITVAAEQGVVGLLLYLMLLAAALRRLFGRGVRSSVARIAIGAAFVGLLVHTMAYADFLEDPAAWTLLGIGGVLARAPD